jgi:hypothetical protein
MAMKAKTYRRPGGVIALPREMVGSPQYKALSLPARALIVELQAIWRPGTKALHLSARRAGKLLYPETPDASTSGARALAELVQAQFLVITDESNWQNGKAREYRLTWQPPDGQLREPTDEWRHGRLATARPTSHQQDGRGVNRPTSRTVATRPPSDRPTSRTVATKHQ